ncbi:MULTISPECIES: threonine/serine dehydratase [Prauserella salsuginis group]|uniref:Threonine/serine dehydratase n=1 Tax=Prauserella salsuginis TaxID=387889 RepID=A0ABW6G4D7_9PSEU|nr:MULTISPECIES: threonine/serine dehydratase [Prauserella salsuginis group]MCR3718182.1 threonine dehydratase [Prauserella flava]MCR3732752.1 threonine dehydratase [Prauserella salsuginis]
MLTPADVAAARDRIRGHIRTTPLLQADTASLHRDSPPHADAAATVWLKLEQLQHTGSFKARGAYNRILAAAADGQLTEAGVVAASGGNAGLAVAHAAARQGVPARVYVPETAPAVKQAKLADLGATVVATGTKYADAYDAATADVAETGALFCHAYDQPEICAGQGTLGAELLEQTGGVDTILVAVGGGGLLAGIAAATEGRAHVVGVEPQTIPTLHTALAEGTPVDVDVSGVAADSLGATRLGEIAHEVAVRTGVASVLVDDADIVAARTLLWREYRIAVEHGTAAAPAALLAGAYRPVAGERVAVVLCGANTDLSDLV